MKTKKIEVKSYWVKQVEAYRSGNFHSKNAYCLQKEVSYHRFLYWYGKLIGELTNKDKLPPASQFVPLQIANKSESPLCTLEFKQGHKLKVHNESVLEKLIDLLSE